MIFGKGEFFAIVVFGLVMLTTIASKNQLKGLVVVCVGVIIGCIGLDEVFGGLRFTFGSVNLYKGISFVTFVMGVYGITELLNAICITEDQGEIAEFTMKNQYPNRHDAKKLWKTWCRCGLLGFGMGLIPGCGGTLATFFAYGLEKSISKNPDEFGEGTIVGVAAPEVTNNASLYGSMVPLLSLGIPFSSSMALLMSAFIIHGITPGPLFITEHPDLFWGLVGSMLLGNVVLLIINLPLVGIWASLLKIDFSILMPLITFITFAGGFAINNSIFDLRVMVVCGFFGFFLSACGYNMAALAVGMFLSGTLESSFLGTMTIYKGNLLTALVSRPIGGVIFLLAVIMLVYTFTKNTVGYFKSRREKK